MSDVRNTERGSEYLSKVKEVREEVDRLLLTAQMLRNQKKEPSQMSALVEKVEIPEYDRQNKNRLIGKLRYKMYIRRAKKIRSINAVIEKENKRIAEEYAEYCRNIRAYNKELEARAAALEMCAEKIVAELDEHIWEERGNDVERNDGTNSAN